MLELFSALRDEKDCPDLSTDDGSETVLSENEMLELQKRNIERALRVCNGKIYGTKGAAALLGVKPTTLATRIQKMEIHRARK